jgi:hypothetical protein
MAKKKKKRRTSKGLARVQAMERGASKASHRVARAVTLGIQAWTRKRKKSSKARRDGAIRDALLNSAFATARMMREASWVTSDFFDAAGPKRDPRRQAILALLPYWR